MSLGIVKGLSDLGIHLPDFGVTEYLGINPGNNGYNMPKSSANFSNGFQQNKDLASANIGTSNNKATTIPYNTPQPTTDTKTKSPTVNTSSKSSTSTSLSDQQKALQKSLAKGFSSTIDAYNNQINALPGQMQDSYNQADQVAGTQKNAITDALNSALGILTNNRGQVQQYQSNTLNQLSDNAAKGMQAMANYLGVHGAADSGAAQQEGQWLTQQANKQRSNAQVNYAGQLNDINNTEVNTRSSADQQLNQVDTWLANQHMQIKNQYDDLQRQLESAKASASDSQKQAIANLQSQLLSAALNRASSISQSASQVKNLLAQGLQTGGSIANSGAITSGAQNVQVTSVPAAQIQALPNATQRADGSILDTATGNLWIPQQDGSYVLSQNQNIGNQVNF